MTPGRADGDVGPPRATSHRFAAIVLAGGTSRRLGGVDKLALPVGGVALLDRVIAACAGAERIVAVGVARSTLTPVEWTREQPAGGGPLAGLAAGLATIEAIAAAVAVVLAGDLPFLTAADVARLVAGVPGYDAAAFTDEDGVAQPLVAAYAVPVLAAALRRIGPPEGLPVRRLFSTLHVRYLPGHGATRDCDTPDELRLARSELG